MTNVWYLFCLPVVEICIFVIWSSGLSSRFRHCFHSVSGLPIFFSLLVMTVTVRNREKKNAFLCKIKLIYFLLFREGIYMAHGSSTSDWNTLTILLEDRMQRIRYSIIMLWSLLVIFLQGMGVGGFVLLIINGYTWSTMGK